MKILPSDFVQSILILNGKPFSLKEREYLKPIYDGDLKTFLLRTGRQVEKSTTLAGHMLSRVLLIPYYQALYVSPSSEQTRAFSSQKLQPFIQHSPFIQKFYVNNKLTNRVYEKEFLNGSRIMLSYAFLTADRIRGKSADGVYIDEVQDMVADNIPVIEETLSHSQYGYRLYAGTPKHNQTVIEELWRRSSQTEWVVKCEHCGHYNVLGESNITKSGLVCEKCKKPLNPRNGLWVDMVSDFEIKAYRIPQLMVPWIKWQDIWRKYTTYPRAKFYNEVLGLPYDDAAMAITTDLLVKASSKMPMAQKYDPAFFEGVGLYMGIDWATSTPETGSYTVVVIGGFKRDAFHIVYMKRYLGAEADLEHVIKDILRLVKLFNVKKIGADWGVGSGGANAMIRAGLPRGLERVWEYYYSGNQKEMVKWDRRGYKFIINRTETMSNIFLRIRERKLLFPRWEDWKDYAEDFTNIFVDYNSRTGKMFYNKLPGKSDDFVHATNFCYLTGLIDRGIITPVIAKEGGLE